MPVDTDNLNIEELEKVAIDLVDRMQIIRDGFNDRVTNLKAQSGGELEECTSANNTDVAAIEGDIFIVLDKLYEFRITLNRLIGTVL